MEKNCPNFFIYAVQSSKKIEVIIFPFIPGCFSFISNATNFFIHLFFKQVCYEKKLGALYATIRGCSETPVGPLRKFLGSKEDLNWLKIDLNAAKIITIQVHKHAQN